MLEKFVALLRQRLKKERIRTLLENGRHHGIPIERREALVERARTIEWIESQINEIMKLREADIDDDDSPAGADEEPEETPPPRRRPNARNWGA